MNFPHNILTATSPPTYQSLNKNAKVLVLVTDARPYLPESFCRRTPKSTRLREAIKKKKRLSFGHCPKVALTPPPILDILDVNFLSVTFGQP